MDKQKKEIVKDAVIKFRLEDLIQKLQSFSLGLRHEHWETTSYETHKAVELTQETIDGLVDDFVEAYIGLCDGTRPVFKKDLKASCDENAIIADLKGLDVADSSILNIRDEMLSAVYKYKYLKSLK